MEDSFEGKMISVDTTREPVSIVFVGHVDSGKSTISGSLLYNLGKVDDRMVEKYKREAKVKNRESWFMAYIMDTYEWKERGIGDMKLLRHKTDKKIRYILRQDKTLKIVANFYVAESPLCDLKPHQGSEKMFIFSAYDCSDEKPDVEQFVIKLVNAEKAKDFQKHFNDAKEFNKLIKEGKESEAKFAPIFKDKEAEDKKTYRKIR